MKNNNWLELFDLLVDEDLEALASMDVKAEIEAVLQERKNEDPDQLIYCFGCVVNSAKFNEEVVGQRLGDVKEGEKVDGVFYNYICTDPSNGHPGCDTAAGIVSIDEAAPLYRTSLADTLKIVEKNPELGFDLFSSTVTSNIADVGNNRLRLSADEAQEYLDAAHELKEWESRDMSWVDEV